MNLIKGNQEAQAQCDWGEDESGIIRRVTGPVGIGKKVESVHNHPEVWLRNLGHPDDLQRSYVTFQFLGICSIILASKPIDIPFGFPLQLDNDVFLLQQVRFGHE